MTPCQHCAHTPSTYRDSYSTETLTFTLPKLERGDGGENRFNLKFLHLFRQPIAAYEKGSLNDLSISLVQIGLDRNAKSEAARSNSEVETVGEINRA